MSVLNEKEWKLSQQAQEFFVYATLGIIPEELFDRLKKHLGEEGLIVLTTMGMFMIANNYFNDILHVQSEFLQK